MDKSMARATRAGRTGKTASIKDFENGAGRPARSSSATTVEQWLSTTTPSGLRGIDIRQRTAIIVDALGSRASLAKTLNVAASQPTRWMKGEESPNPENTRAIVDLEHVVTRARLLWSDDETVNAWLTGRNAFLEGARPIDVVALRGTGPVVDALDQEASGAFA